MSKNAKSLRGLGRIAAGLFLVSFVLYVFGAIRVYMHVCDHVARSTAMGAVALGICAAGLVTTITVAVGTLASWLTLIGVLLLLLAMYLGISATVPPGCPVV